MTLLEAGFRACTAAILVLAILIQQDKAPSSSTSIGVAVGFALGEDIRAIVAEVVRSGSVRTSDVRLHIVDPDETPTERLGG